MNCSAGAIIGATVLLALIADRLCIWGVQQIRRDYYHRQVDQLSTLLSPGQTILDLGSGTGYLGRQVRNHFVANIVCADVQDRNSSDVPFVIADGSALPFVNRTFDIVFLCYMLHHSSAPDCVLAEARRVACGIVIVIEDTPRNLLERLTGFLHGVTFRLVGKRNAMSMHSADEWEVAFARARLQVVQTVPVHRLAYPIGRALFVLRAMDDQ